MTRIERLRASARRRLSAVVGRQATGRQRMLAGAGAVAALLALGAALPAGAKTEITLGVASGASMTIRSGAGVTSAVAVRPQVTFQAGPVKFVGAAAVPARPRFASSVGHYAIGAASARQVMPFGTVVYVCPPYGYEVAAGSYAVPLYDYRADRFARPRHAYGYGYNRRVAPAAPQQARQETLGTFNLPAGYIEIGLTETPRPSFEPRIVQLAGTSAPSGPLPTVHKPAGKNHIHID